MRYNKNSERTTEIETLLSPFAAKNWSLAMPFLATAFGFTHVNLTEYLIAIGLGVLVVPIVETVKFFQRKAAK